MDLLLAARTVWRYRRAALAVLLLTVLAAVGLAAGQRPEYTASASFVLINPPPPPTDAELRANPALATARPDNPFARFDSPWVIVDVLAKAVTTDAARAALVRAGADRRYLVAVSAQYGLASSIVQVTGVGSSAESAVRSARLVSRAATDELYRMQRAQGVDRRYLITALALEVPRTATLHAASRLRSLLGVAGLGGVLTLIVPAALDAVRRWRLELAAPRRAARTATEATDAR